jgi:uncharacterized protein YhbP (UPF0306 family)
MANRLQRRTEMTRSGDIAARITAFLEAHHVMSLATWGPRGPHATNVFYARDGFSLLWVSERQTRHSQMLEVNPQVAATIAPDYRDFDEICGVQVFGAAHRINDAAGRDHARRLLEARYPVLQRLSDQPILKRIYAAAELYRLVPDRMVIIDNKRGFGHKDELSFEFIERT